MTKRWLTAVCFFAAITACNNPDSLSGKPESDADAARMFIRAALNGEWKAARRLIVPDSSNIEHLETVERAAARYDVTTQRGYRESQISFHDTREVNDSTTVMVYSNTFKNQRDSVKVIRLNGDWLVDLKYSFPNSPAQ